MRRGCDTSEGRSKGPWSQTYMSLEQCGVGLGLGSRALPRRNFGLDSRPKLQLITPEVRTEQNEARHRHRHCAVGLGKIAWSWDSQQAAVGKAAPAPIAGETIG